MRPEARWAISGVAAGASTWILIHSRHMYLVWLIAAYWSVTYRAYWLYKIVGYSEILLAFLLVFIAINLLLRKVYGTTM